MLVACGRVPREAEVEASGTIVQLRAIPLIVGGSGPARWSWCGT